jgi:hypothetical protein
MDTQIATPERPVHLFLDFSNITCGARAAAVRAGDDPSRVRLHAESLFRLMAAGRPVASATLVANAGVGEAVLAHYRPDFEVITVESGRDTGRDQAADEILQNRQFLAISRPEPPGVIVVATGDGAGWHRGVGFVPTLTVARRHGYGVEVLSFSDQLHPRLRAFAECTGVVIDLDRYYGQITFLEGLRSPLPLLLHHRPTAEPHPWRPGELNRLVTAWSGDAA